MSGFNDVNEYLMKKADEEKAKMKKKEAKAKEKRQKGNNLA